MKIIGQSDQFVFIGYDGGEPTPTHIMEVVFVKNKVFDFVNNFVEVVGIAKTEDHWEEDKHNKIIDLILTICPDSPTFTRREVCNSLSALGL